MTQTLIAFLIVALAAAFLVLRLVRGRRGCASGGCARGGCARRRD